MADQLTDDPDEIQYLHEVSKRDPAEAIAAINQIEVHLRYGIPGLKFLGWVIAILLTLILWRVWGFSA